MIIDDKNSKKRVKNDLRTLPKKCRKCRKNAENCTKIGGKTFSAEMIKFIFLNNLRPFST